jgi:site-specific DNA recombinase
MTLNVLLSFAQFEREFIGERVRDKIAASKRNYNGLWVGGPIPLGYATLNKKLAIVPEDAETVRSMFRLYLECGSVGALAEELARRNIMSKVRTFSSGRAKDGGGACRRPRVQGRRVSRHRQRQGDIHRRCRESVLRADGPADG